MVVSLLSWASCRSAICILIILDQVSASAMTRELIPDEINGAYFAVQLGLVFVFLCLRQYVETFIYRPLGVYCGLRPHEKRLRLEKNDYLERAYKRKELQLDPKHLQVLSTATQLSERQIQRWFRVRKALDKPSTLVKFTESGWRLTFYTSMVVYGFYHLSSKAWFLDVSECWTNFPNDPVDEDTLWYYTIGQSFYLSCIISSFSDVRRKDFVEMFVHHCVTFFLLFASFYCNAVRIGSLIMLVHDVSDIFMESSKMFHYVNLKWVCDTCFCVFTITWVVTRLYIFPFKIIKNVMFESRDLPQLYPGVYYSCTVALLTLLCLHIVWSYYIYRVFYQHIFAGKPTADPRSASSGSDSESSGLEALTSDKSKQSRKSD